MCSNLLSSSLHEFSQPWMLLWLIRICLANSRSSWLHEDAEFDHCSQVFLACVWLFVLPSQLIFYTSNYIKILKIILYISIVYAVPAASVSDTDSVNDNLMKVPTLATLWFKWIDNRKIMIPTLTMMLHDLN